MNQRSVWLGCLLLFRLLFLSFQASPELTLPLGNTGLVVLSETEPKQKELITGITCSDVDGDATRVYFQSVTPTNPCGKCFTVWPCDTGYCLMYTTSLGTLSYSSAASYLVNVVCTDEDTTDILTVEVRIEANSAPTFDVPDASYVTYTSRATENKRAGDVIYDADATDVDGDAVFYTLSSDPDSGFFEIGYGSGAIHATKDLRLLCDDTTRFFISAQDSYHQPTQDVIVDVDFRASNIRPVIENVETEVEIPEDAPVNSALVQISLNDDTLYNSAIFKLRAVPERGLEYYYLSEQSGKMKIRTRRELDYEYADLRTVTLYLDVTDGFCDAETYSVTVEITDVNEEPVIDPDYIERTVYEGFIELDPGWKVVDPDEGENIKWTMTNDAVGRFYIDQDSGVVFSNGEFEVDKDRVQKTRTVQVEVTDKDGEKDTATLVITILDKNDNPPYFLKSLYEFTASNCTKVGALIGKISARDDDSEFQGNDVLVLSGTGANISVLSTGDVTLKTQCVPGTTETIQGYVTDQGTYPGPLSGVPTTIQFSCNPCPVPTITVTTPNTTTADDGGGNDADPVALHLGWAILAALLACLLAALLAYVIWRYCIPACKRSRARRARRRKSTKPKTEKHKEKEQPRPETPSVIYIPPPPEPPPPEAEPSLFGFWKETYVDRDQRQMPQRHVIPATVTQDKVVEEKEKVEEEIEKEGRRQERERVEENFRQELEKYHQDVEAIRNPPPPPPPKKKSFCQIL